MKYEDFLDETKHCFADGEKAINEGNFDEAMKLFDKALSLQKEKFGEKHESVAVCYMQQGMCNMMQSKFEAARDNFKSSLDVVLKLFAYNSQEVGNCYYLLATAYFQMQDYENASLNFGHVVIISTNLFGATAEQSNTARAMYNKSMYLKSQANPNEMDKQIAEMTDDEECFKKGSEYFDGGVGHLSIQYFNRAIDIRHDNGVDMDDKLVDYYRALAIAYTEVDVRDKAEETLKILLDMCLKLYGEVSKEVAGTYNYLGYNYLIAEDYDKAIDNMKKMLDINMELLGNNHPEVIREHAMMSDIYRMKGDIDNAIAYGVIVEGLLLELNNEDVEGELGMNYGNLAHLYCEKRDFKNQILCLEKQLKIVQKLESKPTKNLIQIYNDLAIAHHALGNMNEADGYMALCQKTMEELQKYEAEHPEECSCGHDHHHHDDECGCGHDHHHHDDECGCEHDHHHHDDECGCGHDHHHHDDCDCDCD